MQKKLLAGILTLSTLFTCAFTGISCSKNNQEAESLESVYMEELEKSFSTEFVNTAYVKLMAVTPMMASVSNDSVSQTLIATVYPSTALNKAVDWSVAWADDTKTEDVNNYVTVTPSMSDGNMATVTCHQTFEGNIIVTVTTRESGYTADCIVSFVGVPTEMNISSSLPEGTDGYSLGIGNAYTFDVTLNNPFGSVGEDYQNITATLQGVGSMILSYKEYYISSGRESWSDSSNKEVTLDSLKDNFITVNCENGVLTINTLKSIESYCGSVKTLDGGRTKVYTDLFRSYVSDCYFTVKLEEITSGLSETIKIRFDNSLVAGVEMDNNDMFF